METMDSAARDKAKVDLVSLYTRSSGRALRLAMVQNGTVDVLGPFTTRVRLEHALADLDGQPAAVEVGDNAAAPPAANGPMTPADSTPLFDVLAANAAQFGSDWSAVLLVGQLPKLDPAVMSYAEALLSRRFTTAQLRVFLLSPATDDEAWGPLFQTTSGAVAHSVADVSPLLETATLKFVAAKWTPMEPPAGFVLASAVLADGLGETILSVPDLADAQADLPTVERYAVSQRQLSEASALEAAPQSNVNLLRIHDLLTAAVQVNPVDPGLLRLEALYCEQTNSFVEASKAAVLLSQVRPADEASFAVLGHALLSTAAFDPAKTALDRAAALHAPPQELAEDYAHVYLGLKQERAALPYLDAVLQKDGSRQDLWFLQASTAEHLQDSALAIHSFEKGLALGGVHIAESGDLVRLYLSTGKPASAQKFALQTIGSLPADVGVRSQFAEALETANLSGESLAAWKSVLALRPDVERAQVRVAQLLLNAGDAPASEDAAAAGLEALPKSAALYLIEAEAIDKQGHEYRARAVLQQGSSVSADSELLARTAVVQDVHGEGSAEAYARLASVLEKQSAQRLQALERGFTVALRDDNLSLVAALATQLDAAGHSEYRAMLGGQHNNDSQAIVPGGLSALAYMARAKPTGPEGFFAEYARAIADKGCVRSCGGDEFSEELRHYFETVGQLESMGKRTGDSVEIVLSLGNKESRRQAEEVLRLLGMEIKTEKGKITLDRGQNKGQLKKQDVVSALGFDEIAMQEAFQAGTPYKLTIRDEPASVYPSAKLWAEAFDSSSGGGFALTLLRSPQLAKLYLGVSNVEQRTLSVLLEAINLKNLSTGDYTGALALYGTSFALQGTHAAVPGGQSAEPLWAHLVGANPAQASAFFLALLQPHNAKHLAFFYALSQLDPRHQAFFTASIDRADHFFALFSAQLGSQTERLDLLYNSSFTEFLRSVPLDQQGHVEFPGSPEVWTVAKGSSSDNRQVAKLMKRVAKTAAPDVEDAVLLRMANTRYKDKTAKGSELDNFLAVSHIDAHRSDPLDDESSLLLAQRYGEFSQVYPYFTDIPGIGASGFRSFFAAIDNVRSRPPLEQNLELGQFYPLIEWLAVLNRRHTIEDAAAAQLFSRISDLFGAAGDPGAFTTASLVGARAILSNCAPGATGSADDSLRGCLLGIRVPESSQRAKDYGLVLDSQKAPSLDALFSMQEAAETILKGATSPAAPDVAIAKAAAALPSVPLPKLERLASREKEAILLYGLEEIQKVSVGIGQAASKQKQNPKAVKKLAADLLNAMEPQVTLALSAPLYAYFLRSNDLVIAEDPLLLRKHRYFDFVSTQPNVALAEPEFIQNSEGLGSYFQGGFAQFGLAAGRAAAAGWKQGGAGGNAVMSAQIAALRTTDWDRLEESDLRLASLRILVAREWIVRSAQNPPDFEALRDDTAGILSLSRRADLLNSIEERDWKEVWASITLPDLFDLGGRYLSRYPADPVSSPVTTELRIVAATNDGSRLNLLGRIPYQVMGCSHPHLVGDAPYEEYERRMLPEDMAERSAEFKLFLAYRANNLGVEPSDLSSAAEQLAARAFRAARMTDYHDWRSLLAGYASITNEDLRKALEQ
jgi:hypothetical protein